MPHAINTKAEWDALPVGTSVAGTRTGYGRTGITATRSTERGIYVDGLHFIVGGTFWDHFWSRITDVTVMPNLFVTDPSGTYTVTDEDIDVVEAATAAWLERQDTLDAGTREARRARATAVLEALTARGWTPPARKDG